MESKLTDKELQDLRSFTQQVSELDQRVGRLEAQKMNLLAARNMKNTDLQKLHQRIAKKYGDNGVVNMATGEFNPHEE